jgi:formate hydrogenlyase subunit 3/multisubunit Na+/H+ antiporter MnhD subunit
VTLFLLGLAVLALGGSAALVLSGRPGASLAVGTASAAAGSALGLAGAVRALWLGAPPVLVLPWSEPLAAIRLGLDPLSAFFLVPVFAVSLATALFGASYLRGWLGGRRPGGYLFLFNLLVASMALVFAARQAVLFLVAWEVMAVSSFLLVAFEHGDAEVRRAGFTYLVASHLGTLCLLALFLLLGREAGALDFGAFGALRGRAGLPATLLFALALAGFGTKAGLVPLHVWLPEAHPAAPSPVSALLSAVMIKTGVYGVLRVLGFLPPAPVGWGVLLAALGGVGALAAIALALGQRDVKRALAYSSVENVGLIFLGLGVGLAAAAGGAQGAAALSFAGAMLHVWNHALMKGLAFLGAGAVAHAAHTRDLDRMGGLLSRLPATGTLFLVGAAALAALPPLNGFASEWLLYMGLLESARAEPGAAMLAGLLGVAGLAAIGAVAAAAFARLAGLSLLGAARSPSAAAAREPGPGTWVPLLLLALGCAGAGLFPAELLDLAGPAIAQVARLPGPQLAALLRPTAAALAGPMRVAVLALAALLLLAFALRRQRLARHAPATSETWGCGYARPTARMQYSGASFAQLLLESAPRLLAPRGRVSPPRGLLPARASLELSRVDPARRLLFAPLFLAAEQRLSALRRFQAGRLHLQLLYTVLTLVALVLYLAVDRP